VLVCRASTYTILDCIADQSAHLLGSSCSHKMNDISNMSKRVVIIGGGLSAKHSAETLIKKAKKEFDVTIIQANNFVEWPLAMTVCLVKPDSHDRALATDPNKFQVPGVTYKYGVVESVNPTAKQVVLQGDGGEMVPYNYLIVATGFRMPLVYPGLGVSLAERKEEVQAVGEAIKKGASIVVAGGGPVGLELVGDIRAQYPNSLKKIQLLCKDDVLSQWPEKKRTKVAAQLKEMNIEVIKSAERFPTEHSLEPGTIKLGDKEVSYDVYLPMFSQGPNTKFLPDSVMDGKGCVDVNEHLQSTVYKDIFAVGVSNVKEPFIGMPKLEAQWNSVTANIIASAKGKPLTKHQEGAKFMQLPPLVLIGHGPKGYGYFDCDNVPPPIKCCCCCGLGGFPCCPPCWPCCACAGCSACPFGYCCGAPEGKGPATLGGTMAFKSAGFHFKGVGAPPQQTMASE